jgi:trehalose-phosphatase
MARRSADALADEVARAARRRIARRTLILDLDGTLAPIARTPEEARVPAATLDALGRLVAEGWKVAVVSGRPVDQVRAMVPVRGVLAFGSHGIEGRRGPRRAPALPRGTGERLTAIAAAAKQLARGTRGARVERKPVGIAIHDRAVAHEDLPAWRRRVRTFLAAQDLLGLELLRGHRVVEIRPHGHTKGDVLEFLAPQRGEPSFDASLVALGDDSSDDDLFRALWQRGLGVQVGRSGRISFATRMLASPAAVRRFLERLAGLPDGGVGAMQAARKARSARRTAPTRRGET